MYCTTNWYLSSELVSLGCHTNYKIRQKRCILRLLKKRVTINKMQFVIGIFVIYNCFRHLCSRIRKYDVYCQTDNNKCHLTYNRIIKINIAVVKTIIFFYSCMIFQLNQTWTVPNPTYLSAFTIWTRHWDVILSLIK